MAEKEWRPLFAGSDDEVAEYDALHDGVPEWMAPGYWAWIEEAITTISPRGYYSTPERIPKVDLIDKMAATLQLPLQSFQRVEYLSPQEIRVTITSLRSAPSHKSLAIADFLLAEGHGNPHTLANHLNWSKSAWQVGTRLGKPGLVRRVPEGVQEIADSTMASAGKAGKRLAEAWGALYGLKADSSRAYGLAIKAVEDAVVPVVSPKNQIATLGTVIRDMENQKDWELPMIKTHSEALPGDVLRRMMRVLWHGQHDRHGGPGDEPSAPGNVSQEEAIVAVHLASAIIALFDAGLPERASKKNDA